MHQLYVTIFNWLISGYTLESELIILSDFFCKKSIVHTWGSLQSEFLYVENAFRKLAVALPFWNNKTEADGTENKLERRPYPRYFDGVGYDRMYWSAAYAVHGLAG